MIDRDQTDAALRCLQRLIVVAKQRAYQAGASDVAELLNDIELLPEMIGDASDRSSEFIEALDGLLAVHPDCRFAVEAVTSAIIARQ